MANKVKYGLSNVYYAVATLKNDGTATYGTPVRWPGAVNLSLDAEGDVTKFRADDTDYWVGQSNNGYSGDFESALIPDSFMKDILGFIEDADGVLIENADAPTKPFALLFQFKGDETNARRVMYNCTVSRPSVNGQTTENTITPQTESVTITASPIWNEALQCNIVNGKVYQTQAAYGTWYDAVHVPTGTEPATYTVTQKLTNVTSSFSGTTVSRGASFSATLTADSSMTLGTVTVTMGGEDITSTAYDDNGAVTIAAVTGNVTISADAS